ncbi:hypothetical protein J6590_027368 [Homalodisca vitripennis]|nr:hypothetical protein J6590_027368 [Homalodisca vitripennis]
MGKSYVELQKVVDSVAKSLDSLVILIPLNPQIRTPISFSVFSDSCRTGLARQERSFQRDAVWPWVRSSGSLSDNICEQRVQLTRYEQYVSSLRLAASMDEKLLTDLDPGTARIVCLNAGCWIMIDPSPVPREITEQSRFQELDRAPKVREHPVNV